ncbi:GntR family transcriptional regulator [Sedimentitalea arenosa]|uniref:GntR family transcriptional regulator n=1 Tax=Sedimentitalea arenosa TaxID=2798803 RepID=A0A8J7IR36_9RHOB|nr:GntR family transcriptional regulator [Arenibacterium arenosum]MBJ6372076.1 GntR family transcriptional regulator [Arenibacterium arenosum]
MVKVENAAKRSTGASPSAPAHEQVYRQLRAQILFGEMAPGQAVTIQGLTAELNAGMTPVREAIRRLISDGALVFQGNRRVSVPQLSKSDVEQIVYVRKSIEYQLCERAVNRITDALIDTLDLIDQELDAAISSGNVGRYLERNYQFHATLYAQADAPILAEITDRLWLRFGPSLRVVCGRFGTESLPDRHKDLLTALRARNVAAATAAVLLDIEQGMDQISAVLAAQN